MCVISAWDNALSESEREAYAPWRDEQGLLHLTEVPLVSLWTTTTSGHVFPGLGARKSSEGSSHSWGLTPTEASTAYNAYHIRIKLWAPALGLDPRDISTHSARRGPVSETVHCGLAETFAKVHGRWRSDKGYRRYIDHEVALRKHAQGLHERLVIYCRTTSASAAHATHCATFCTPCQPPLRAFSRWIRSPPPSPSPLTYGTVHTSYHPGP